MNLAYLISGQSQYAFTEIMTTTVIDKMTLSSVSKALDVELISDDAGFTAVSTDTRTLREGDLFVALSGPNFDGHNYVKQASDKGAVAAVVDHKVETSLPLIIVDDTRHALGQMAAAWRAGFDIPLIAVTGSNGKTTVKEMLASILGQGSNTLITQGNLNNEIGVPLTLLRLRETHQHAVIEMGANHPGEIDYLTSVAQPTASIITNASAAHLEGFSDVDGVARAKGEIIEGLDDQGTVILNADDVHTDYWRRLAGKRRCFSFGIENQADVHTNGDEITSALAKDGHYTTFFKLHTPVGVTDITLKLPGRHNVMNALAAAAGALAVGTDLNAIAKGLATMHSVKGRLQMLHGTNDATIIDDTYNANPASLQAGLDVLASMKGDRVLVLGDMAELGENADDLHRLTIEQAHKAGIDRIYTLGEHGQLADSVFGAQARHFETQQDLIQALKDELTPDSVVLVKGSRCMHMETVVEALTQTKGKH